MAFVKLDCGILDSTIWPDREAREMFITALLMAEPIEIQEPTPTIKIRSLEEDGFVIPIGWYGFVPAASTGIARRAGIDTEIGLSALERLASPEVESRTPDYEGRRLVRVDGGFIALNFELYRTKDHTAAERSRRYREKKLASRVTDVASRVASRSVTQAEAEAEAEAPKREIRNGKPTLDECKAYAVEIKLPEVQAVAFFNFYQSKGWKVGKTPMVSFHHSMAGWKTRWQNESGQSEPKPQKDPDVWPTDARFNYTTPPARSNWPGDEQAFQTHWEAYQKWHKKRFIEKQRQPVTV